METEVQEEETLSIVKDSKAGERVASAGKQSDQGAQQARRAESFLARLQRRIERTRKSGGLCPVSLNYGLAWSNFYIKNIILVACAGNRLV